MNSFTCKDLYLNYYEDKKSASLKNINISLPQTGIVGIVGPSGSGKSSFLYSLAGLKKQYVTGQLTYNGMDCLKCDDKELSKINKSQFGFIFQKHFLIPYLTTIENILVGVNDVKYVSEARKWMKVLSIDQYENKLVTELSGGECQRVAIARGLLHKPKVVFADEPTAALDKISCEIVMESFKKMRQNTLFLIVSHDANVQRYFDYTIKFMDGAICERINL